MPHALDKIRVTRQPKDLLEHELLNHCVCHKTSFLAAKILEEDHELSVCRTSAYFIGVYAVSRDSQYFATEKEAQEALDNRSWEQRMDP